jgi:hypothetical protein
MSVHHRVLTDYAAFSPDSLRVIYEVFDDAWSEVGANYSGEAAEAARNRLAEALLREAGDATKDLRSLKRRALLVLSGKQPAPRKPTKARRGRRWPPKLED